MSTSGMRDRMYAVAWFACVVSGCASLSVPRIDPTGERIFAEPPVAARPPARAEPPVGRPDEGLALTLSPRLTVAPVGSEVVLLAGVRGSDSYLRTNQRLEWSLAPGGVGHFVAVGKGGLTDLLLGDFTRPRKIDNTFAVGSTSRRFVWLNRGTPTTSDDVCVLSGQGWITLSSPIEGTSRVTVLAPHVPAWDARLRTATVHWVDAQWQFPPPAINPAGTRHAFTTTVVRHSDGAPCAGWPVRYEIVDGPPAGFAPEGASTVEVATDAAGQAVAEIFQTEPGPGTNRINIQVFRPAPNDETSTGRLLLGSGTTLKTWTAAELDVRKTATATVGMGGTLRYTIEISNPGSLPAEDVTLVDQLPDGLSYLQSKPAAEQSAGKLTWRLGQLAAGQSRVLELACRAEQRGSVTNCVDATAAGGLKAADCATTTVMPAVVDVSIRGPQQATVGSSVTFRVLITNRSQAPTGRLLIKDTFGPGLEHAEAPSPIERDLGSLAPGETQAVDVTFRVTEAGRLCHTVEVTGPGGVKASAEACLTASGAGAGVPPAAPSLSVKKSGPQVRTVGQTAEFLINVTNTGSQPLSNLKVVDRYHASLRPSHATDGYWFEGNDMVWRIDTLPPGKTAQLQVHCRCLQAVDRACNRATVIGADGGRAEDDACLEIRPAEAGLTMVVGDLLDPIRLGRGLTYEIRVSNEGQGAQRQVGVVATVPEGMKPDPIGTSGPGRPNIAGQTVRFDPVAELGPGERLSYHVRVLTQRAGTLTFRAELTSREQAQPLVVEEETQVFE